MIGLAWRITTGGRRAGRAALLIRAAGIAVAVTVLLGAVGADSAMDNRGDRIAWRDEDSATDVGFPEDATMFVLELEDWYRDEHYARILVVQQKENAPVPPGLPRVPAPGETFVSPALAAMIEDAGPTLADRFGPGGIAGVIGKEGLADADEVVAITGAAEPAFGFPIGEDLPRGYSNTETTVFLRTVLAMGVVALLMPIALFIATAAKLDAQNSEIRLAAFRLAGASPRQVRWFVCIESLIALIPGVIAGVLLFFAMRPLLATIHIDGHGFIASDFSFDLRSVAILALAPVVAIAASLWGLRGVEISPLGVRNRSQRRSVQPFGALLLAGGFLVYFMGLRATESGGGADGILLVTVGVIILVAGLAMLGPWMGQLAARMLAAVTGRGSLLLAARRIAADPHASFRTVSGVTFAVFFGTLFLGMSAAIEREAEEDPGPGYSRDILQLLSHEGELVTPPPEVQPRVETVALRDLFLRREDGSTIMAKVGDCATLARAFPITGGCEGPISVRAGGDFRPGESLFIESLPDVGPAGPEGDYIDVPRNVSQFTVEYVGAMTPDLIISPRLLGPVADGAWTQMTLVALQPGEDIEAIRSAIISGHPDVVVANGAELESTRNEGMDELRRLVYLGVFASFLLSGGTAALSVAGSVLARRLPFALLRVVGCPQGTLRKALIAEATLPLMLVSVVSFATAFLAGVLAIKTIASGSAMPPAEFALPLAGGLALGLLLTVSALPLLGRVTAVERARFE